MVIGSLLLSRRGASAGIIALVCSGFIFSARGDEIKKTDGTTVDGDITGVSSGQVEINIAGGKSVVYLSDIQTVNMAPPAAMTQLKDATPATVIATLDPLVKQYAGLPTDWVLDAMGQLADAYDTQGQADKSGQVYAQINQLYPNSPYQKEAVVGAAKLALKQGKIAEALAAVKPIVDQANQNVAPSPAEGRLFAGAFLVYGQALQAQKEYPQALEAFLTVKTMFYQNPVLVAQADQLAEALRAQNPGVAVD
jgi:tetratricopeptide (TPR) repeat protein